MAVYYNEIDPFAADWLENLIDAGHLPGGVVDRRDIRDVSPRDLDGFVQCHFFAGIGGWPLALQMAGWPLRREVWTGSCPCQPFSAAGRGAGFADERHLWPAFFHLVGERRPASLLGEQVASKDGLAWLDLVASDLEGAGYAFGAADLCAAGVGAPHIRQRFYWVGHSECKRAGRDTGAGAQAQGGVVLRSERHDAGPPGAARWPGPTNGFWRDPDWLRCRDGKWRPVEPDIFPLAHGASARVGKLRAAGNAIVPQVAAAFIEAVM